MKSKFLKHFCVYLCAVMVFVSCFVVPASAASFPDGLVVDDFYLDKTLYAWNPIEPYIIEANYDVYHYAFWISAGDYLIEGRSANLFPGNYELLDFFFLDMVSGEISRGFFGDTLTVPDTAGEYGGLLMVQSVSDDIVISIVGEPAPLFQSVWDLLAEFIYGVGVELTPDMRLTLTLLATLLVIAVVAIPFAIVWIVIAKLFSWW